MSEESIKEETENKEYFKFLREIVASKHSETKPKEED